MNLTDVNPKISEQRMDNMCSEDLVKNTYLIRETRYIRKRKTREQWSNEETNLFFEALSIYGKNFESIWNYMSLKRGQSMSRNKEQIRHFYYRTWAKLSKYIKYKAYINSAKKPNIELICLLSYGELRKRFSNYEDKRFRKILLEHLSHLIFNGSSTAKIKDKKIRIKLPICEALKNITTATNDPIDVNFTSIPLESNKDLINELQFIGEPIIENVLWNVKEDTCNLNNKMQKTSQFRIPNLIPILMYPKSSSEWTFVQSLSFNPRIKLKVHHNSKLQEIADMLAKRWSLLTSKHTYERESTLIGKSQIIENTIKQHEEITPCYNFMPLSLRFSLRPCDAVDLNAKESKDILDMTISRLYISLKGPTEIYILYAIQKDSSENFKFYSSYTGTLQARLYRNLFDLALNETSNIGHSKNLEPLLNIKVSLDTPSISFRHQDTNIVSQLSQTHSINAVSPLCIPIATKNRLNIQPILNQAPNLLFNDLTTLSSKTYLRMTENCVFNTMAIPNVAVSPLYVSSYISSSAVSARNHVQIVAATFSNLSSFPNLSPSPIKSCSTITTNIIDDTSDSFNCQGSLHRLHNNRRYRGRGRRLLPTLAGYDTKRLPLIAPKFNLASEPSSSLYDAPTLQQTGKLSLQETSVFQSNIQLIKDLNKMTPVEASALDIHDRLFSSPKNSLIISLQPGNYRFDNNLQKRESCASTTVYNDTQSSLIFQTSKHHVPPLYFNSTCKNQNNFTCKPCYSLSKLEKQLSPTLKKTLSSSNAMPKQFSSLESITPTLLAPEFNTSINLNALLDISLSSSILGPTTSSNDISFLPKNFGISKHETILHKIGPFMSVIDHTKPLNSSECMTKTDDYLTFLNTNDFLPHEEDTRTIPNLENSFTLNYNRKLDLYSRKQQESPFQGNAGCSDLCDDQSPITALLFNNDCSLLNFYEHSNLSCNYPTSSRLALVSPTEEIAQPKFFSGIRIKQVEEKSLSFKGLLTPENND